MPFAFIHIPKNAGKSYFGAIANHTGLSTAPLKLMAMYYRQPIGSYGLYGGHTFYQNLVDILPPGTKYFTILRDPINRTYSHWRYLLDGGGIGLYGVPRTITFSEFIRHPNTCNLASNFQCRYLTMRVEKPPPQRQRLKWQIAMEQLPFEAVAENTIAVLRTFLSVGTQEEFASSVMTTCMAMGYSPPGHVKEVKKNYYDRISKEDLEFLAQSTKEDMRVYNEFK